MVTTEDAWHAAVFPAAWDVHLLGDFGDPAACALHVALLYAEEEVERFRTR
ncbi:hypothetical protein [Streptomyces scopuliridis]|uniref:hypothetical protein n=1 Tax=Streptomyces scopuliridis TaxID=452529 RepID=UPI0034258A2B